MNFDLNVENYNENELLDMFGLSKFYDQNMLDINETKIIDNINSNNKINQEVKSKTISFIVKAKNILLANVNNGRNTSSFLEQVSGLNGSNANNVQSKITELYHLNAKLQRTNIENPQDHMVQVRPPEPYITSNPRNYLPGIINPLKKTVFRQYLNVDSRFRDNYYGAPSTNFFMALPINLNKIINMQLMSLELPTTYYVVSKQFGNNFFKLIVEGEEPVVINVPNGNYSSSGIVNYLNSEMQKLGGNFQYISFNVNIDSNNDGSNQMIVSIDPIQNISFSLDFQSNALGTDDRNTPLPLKLGWNLGFRNGIYENNTTYVSEGVIDFSGPRYMYLAIDDYNNNVSNSFYSAFNSSILNNNNILARISINSQNYTIFNENNFNVVTFPRMYYGPVNIKNITVQLLDEYGRIVDLNNMDYSFCLTFETAYDI